MKYIILKIVFKLLKYNRFDVNLDGKVDIKDLLMIQKYILEKGDK